SRISSPPGAPRASIRRSPCERNKNESVRAGTLSRWPIRINAVTRPLWACPKCGAKFVSANMSHSCGRFDLDRLFAKSDPHVLAAFERLRRMIERCGRVVMIPQKTRVVFMTRMRFAAVYPQKSSLRLGLILRRAARHRSLDKIDTYGPNSIGNYFRINSAADLDPSLQRLLREGYERGNQTHLHRAPAAVRREKSAIRRNRFA